MTRPRAVFWMEVAEWKKQLAAGSIPDQQTCLQKVQLDTQPKALEGEGVPARAIRFVVSGRTVDRDNDTINPKGWKLDDFLKNPVIPFAHDYRSLPVAKAQNTVIEGESLVSTAIFPTREVYPFGDTVYQMVREGFLSAVSVGFRPKAHEVNKERGGIDFLEQELLEYSIVPVPSNPDALIQARSLGIDVTPIKSWAMQALDELYQAKGIWMPKEVLEGVLSQLKGKTVAMPGREWTMHLENGDQVKALIETNLSWIPSKDVAGTSSGSAVVAIEQEGTVPEDPVVDDVEEKHDQPEDGYDWSEWEYDDLEVATVESDTTSKGSEEVRQLSQAIQEAWETEQKINPIILYAPLPGSYQAITEQLEDQARNFLTANGFPYRPDYDRIWVLATFVDSAIFCVLGRDRPFEDDPCYKATWAKSEEVVGLPQWTGEPKKIDIQVSMSIIQQTHLATWKQPVSTEESWDEEEILASMGSIITEATHDLAGMVQDATAKAIRFHQGRVD